MSDNGVVLKKFPDPNSGVVFAFRTVPKSSPDAPESEANDIELVVFPGTMPGDEFIRRMELEAYNRPGLAASLAATGAGIVALTPNNPNEMDAFDHAISHIAVNQHSVKVGTETLEVGHGFEIGDDTLNAMRSFLGDYLNLPQKWAAEVKPPRAPDILMNELPSEFRDRLATDEGTKPLQPSSKFRS